MYVDAVVGINKIMIEHDDANGGTQELPHKGLSQMSRAASMT